MEGSCEEEVIQQIKNERMSMEEIFERSNDNNDSLDERPSVNSIMDRQRTTRRPECQSNEQRLLRQASESKRFEDKK